MRIDFVISLDAALLRLVAIPLASIDARLNQLIQLVQGETMDLTALKAKVQQNTDVANSAVVLINGIAAQLRASASDPVAIQALADQLEATDTALGAAVAANTPAAV